MTEATVPTRRPGDMHPGNHPTDVEERGPVITIDVKVNGRTIASAQATNMSNLAEDSEYQVRAIEEAHRELGLSHIDRSWVIDAHARRQSVWALVHKIAASMTLFQNETRLGVDK